MQLFGISAVSSWRDIQDTARVKIEIRYLARVCLRIDLKRSEAEFEINSETHECEISDLNFDECGIVVLTHIIPFFDPKMSTLLLSCIFSFFKDPMVHVISNVELC